MRRRNAAEEAPIIIEQRPTIVAQETMTRYCSGCRRQFTPTSDHRTCEPCRVNITISLQNNNEMLKLHNRKPEGIEMPVEQ